MSNLWELRALTHGVQIRHINNFAARYTIYDTHKEIMFKSYNQITFFLKTGLVKLKRGKIFFLYLSISL